MTTPKELAEEFRRLGEQARFYQSDTPVGKLWKQRRIDFEQAAQMVEERLGVLVKDVPVEQDGNQSDQQVASDDRPH